MPQLSDTMHSGKILVWHKNIGDAVKRGDILAEVETDKANLEIESFQEGTLLEIRTPADKVANVGDIICLLGAAGEKVAANGSSNGSAAPKVAPQAAQSTPTPPTQQNVAPAPRASHESSDRIKASPLARKIAASRDIDLASVSGTGPMGRITKRDLESATPTHSSSSQQSHQAPTQAAPQQAKSPAPSAPLAAPGSVTPLSKMRETIARRMQQSVAENPHFYVTVAVRMEQSVKLREALKHKEAYKGISVNHFVIKACAYALEHEPRVNAAFRDNGVYQPEAINIGIITALPDGLLIPVIKDTNKLSLKDVVFEARAAIERAKAGRPSSSDLTGGTFSISNMGMYDVENFTAIINPGQGGVIAVSAVKETPVVENGAVIPGLVMKATISVDHRVIDGVMAANFMKYFKEALELPALLMTGA